MPGEVEDGDGFGSGVATAEFGTDGGRLHLAVGSPTENLGRVRDAGMLTITSHDPETAEPLPARSSALVAGLRGCGGVPHTRRRVRSSGRRGQLSQPVDDEDEPGVVLATVPGRTSAR